MEQAMTSLSVALTAEARNGRTEIGAGTIVVGEARSWKQIELECYGTGAMSET